MRSAIFLTLLFFLQLNVFSQVTFKTDVSQPGKPISQDLIGVFFEDINYAADGGLYAELVQNRSFEYYKVPGYVDLEPLHAWSLVQKGGASAIMEIENAEPLNANNTKYLKLTIEKSGTEAGIKNSGFDGIPVSGGEVYRYSVYLRSEKKYKQTFVIRIETADGFVLGSDTINAITRKWEKYSGEITCSASCKTANLTLVTPGKGTFCFDMVSLFPKNTFKNRENGLRKDLATAIAELKPRFVRFPGGCISHGRGLDNAYRWKESIGDVAERKPNWNTWGYHQTYGIGFFEYFQFSEDVGAIPLPVVPVGISCQFRDREIAPLNEMKPWIDDALDLIEFANGDVNTVWGKKRAEMGHPEPFKMEYICFGNEEDDIPEFRERFKMIADSVRKYHPEIKIIGTSGTNGWDAHYNSLWDFSKQEALDAVDEHYYVTPDWMLNNNHRYDNFDRNGPKVFIGEYASWGDRLQNAIAEAAYLTGVERNGDVIQFTCYAPLLCHEDHNHWNPDLIRFDNTRISKTTNYYVQQLYSLYSGDEYVNSRITLEEGFDPYKDIYHGKIGVGTWKTQAEFDNIKVVSGDNVLINEDFSSDSKNWEVINGQFSVSDGVYAQGSNEESAWSVMNVPVNSDGYTYTLMAKKTGGSEGFLVPFGFKNAQDYYWLNLGGWGNTKYAVEKGSGKNKSTLLSIPGSLENEVWYAVKIEVNKSTAKIYLNDELLFTVPAPVSPVTASVVKDVAKNRLIIKMVNSGSTYLKVNMNIDGMDLNQEARVISLTGEPTERNSVLSPDLIVPSYEKVQVKNRFNYTLPANSFKVFILNLDEASPSVHDDRTN